MLGRLLRATTFKTEQLSETGRRGRRAEAGSRITPLALVSFQNVVKQQATQREAGGRHAPGGCIPPKSSEKDPHN